MDVNLKPQQLLKQLEEKRKEVSDQIKRFDSLSKHSPAARGHNLTLKVILEQIEAEEVALRNKIAIENL